MHPQARNIITALIKDSLWLNGKEEMGIGKITIGQSLIQQIGAISMVLNNSILDTDFICLKKLVDVQLTELIAITQQRFFFLKTMGFIK